MAAPFALVLSAYRVLGDRRRKYAGSAGDTLGKVRSCVPKKLGNGVTCSDW